MTDDRVLDYLRSRGQAQPPADLVPSVMAAVEALPHPRSRFSPFIPAFAAAGAVAIVALLALLVGPGRDIGPGPSPATSSPTASAWVEPTIDDLGVALLDAVDVLRAAPGVEGRQQAEIDGTIGSATWFDWRPNGDQVVVQRLDLDVTETGWWMVPDGAPPTTGQRIYTFIGANVGDEYFFTNEAGDWEVAPRADGFRQGALGAAIMDGYILPWRPLDGFVGSLPGESEARVERGDLPDGGVEWQLESQWLGAPVIQRWTIGPGGELRSWSLEREGRSVDPERGFNDNITHARLQFTITDGGPIEPPDTGTEPDAADLGLPADFPLGPGSGAIDYRAYVEDAIDVLEAYHWNSANIDWSAARSAALDGLTDDVTADQAHARIQAAIQTFDFFNTVFVRPRDVPPSDADGGGSGSGEAPAGSRVGDVGVIVLPTPPSSGGDGLAEYVGTARTNMATVEESASACGWVVDLREYDGFAWGPSMFALGGLLGEERVVSFRSPAGEWWLEVDDRGVVSSGGFDESDDPIDSPYIETYGQVRRDELLAEAVAAQPPHMPSVAGAPVAVLVGNVTRSGGEQTLVAFLGRPATRTFGMPTAGTPVVAPNLTMADGAVLRIPTWVPVDRAGTEYATNITPDEVIGDTRATGGDAILDAALDWLETQGCS